MSPPPTESLASADPPPSTAPAVVAVGFGKKPSLKSKIGFHCGGECVGNQAVGVVLISLGLIESCFFCAYNNRLFHVPSFVI